MWRYTSDEAEWDWVMIESGVGNAERGGVGRGPCLLILPSPDKIGGREYHPQFSPPLQLNTAAHSHTAGLRETASPGSCPEPATLG